MSNFLDVASLSCSYGSAPVLSQLSFSLQAGEIACLLGPSGCGKSTLLRAIAGFENLETGSITLKGQTLSNVTRTLAPEKRRIGMVFQDYALFPHLSIEQNIAYGLPKKKETAERIRQLLALIGLDELGTRYPHELSGGQQQRVALARALAPEPELILLDEPFSNLDADLRTRLSLDIRRILKKLNISAILVTHDQAEAFAMSDHIGVIRDGKIEQWGTPFELYHEPSSKFIAQFIGKGSFIAGTSLSAESFATELGTLSGNRSYPYKLNSKVDILLRPDDIVFDSSSRVKARVEHKLFAGTATHYQLVLGSGAEIQATFPSHQDFNIGDTVPFGIDTEHLITYLSEGVSE